MIMGLRQTSRPMIIFVCPRRATPAHEREESETRGIQAQVRDRLCQVLSSTLVQYTRPLDGNAGKNRRITWPF